LGIDDLAVLSDVTNDVFAHDLPLYDF
jgi:hypothetical protein